MRRQWECARNLRHSRRNHGIALAEHAYRIERQFVPIEGIICWKNQFQFDDAAQLAIFGWRFRFRCCFRLLAASGLRLCLLAVAQLLFQSCTEKRADGIDVDDAYDDDEKLPVFS